MKGNEGALRSSSSAGSSQDEPQQRVARLVVAGTASGVGKTTVMVGLIRAFKALGLRVAVFKCGPDYLDPTYHARAAESTCHNLDGWMMGEAAVRATFERAAARADIALIEGVMGLFDGASATSEEGSSAEVAKWLGAPVLLVVDASGMARTIGAVAQGFCGFDPELWLAGLVCNRLGSRGHLQLLRAAQAKPPIFGGLPAQPELAFRGRHLGLCRAGADVLPERVLAGWQELSASWFDLDAVLALARTAPGVARSEPASSEPHSTTPCCRSGVALDDAFHFCYEDNLAGLRELGAKLVYFSPLSDTHLPDVSGVYLGGGYPELHAGALARNQHLRRELVGFARGGGPIYGECGGLMYLCEAIQTLDGELHPMVGLLPGTYTRTGPRIPK